MTRSGGRHSTLADIPLQAAQSQPGMVSQVFHIISDLKQKTKLFAGGQLKSCEEDCDCCSVH